MMKHTSQQNSRKAPEDRAGRISIIQGQVAAANSGPDAEPSAEVIKLGVDTHAGQYTFARMVDHSGTQPTQSLNPAAFVQFVMKQQILARRVVMVYEAGPAPFDRICVECLRAFVHKPGTLDVSDVVCAAQVRGEFGG